MTILVSSLSVSIEFQPLLPAGIFSIHVVPLSAELNMFHADSAATNFVPSIDEKTTCQFFSAGKLVFCVQVPPQFTDLYMKPFFTTATNLFPSHDVAIACQFF